VLIPAPGCFPPTVVPRRDERVLHLAFWNAVSDGRGLMRALSTLGEYLKIDWRQAAIERALESQALRAAAAIQPTLVFLELRGPTPRRGGPTPALLRQVRALCDPRAVLMVFYGDQFHEPADTANAWLLELARAADVFLVCNTQHPAEYARLGVPHPGYLQAGFDAEVFRPGAPAADAPPLAFMGTRHRQPAYRQRNEVVDRLAEACPGALRCYGFGWEAKGTFLAPAAEAAVYASARAALCMSIRNDLPRYTSDRLFRALGSGAVALVERFADCEDLGLVDSVNCFVWRGWDEFGGLRSLVEDLQRGYWSPEDLQELRRRAAALAHEVHTWGARMGELAAIVEAVRG
jgi:hypothetical protein